jgi:polyribonucleotide nucleotidyltransferase
MIEGAADFLPEEIMIEALKLGHAAIGVICDGLAVFQSVAGKKKKIDTLRKLPDDLLNSMEKLFGAKLDVALQIGMYFFFFFVGGMYWLFIVGLFCYICISL